VHACECVMGITHAICFSKGISSEDCVSCVCCRKANCTQNRTAYWPVPADEASLNPGLCQQIMRWPLSLALPIGVHQQTSNQWIFSHIPLSIGLCPHTSTCRPLLGGLHTRPVGVGLSLSLEQTCPYFQQVTHLHLLAMTPNSFL